MWCELWAPLILEAFFLVSLHGQFATEAAITILRIDDMIKLYKDDDGGEEWGVSEAASGVSSRGF